MHPPLSLCWLFLSPGMPVPALTACFFLSQRRFYLLGILRTFRSAIQGLGFSSEHRRSSMPASNNTASPISGLDFGIGTGSGLVGCHRPLWPAGQAHPTQAVRVASSQDSQKAGA